VQDIMKNKKPKGVLVIGVFYFFVFLSVLASFRFMSGARKVYMSINIVLCLYYLVCAFGLVMMKKWGRILALIPAGIIIALNLILLLKGIIRLPLISILIHSIIIFYLTRSRVKEQFV